MLSWVSLEMQVSDEGRIRRDLVVLQIRDMVCLTGVGRSKLTMRGIGFASTAFAHLGLIPQC